MDKERCQRNRAGNNRKRTIAEEGKVTIALVHQQQHLVGAALATPPPTAPSPSSTDMKRSSSSASGQAPSTRSCKRKATTAPLSLSTSERDPMPKLRKRYATEPSEAIESVRPRLEQEQKKRKQFNDGVAEDEVLLPAPGMPATSTQECTAFPARGDAELATPEAVKTTISDVSPVVAPSTITYRRLF